MGGSTDLLVDVVLFGGLAGSATILGILSVLYFEESARRYSSLLVAVAAGVLLGTAFFRLMPEAEEHFAGAHAVVLLGVLMFYLIENRFLIHMCEEEGGVCDVHSFGLIAVMGLGFHSLVDGVAIGAGFQASEAVGILTAVAVIFHEYPEGVIAYSLLLTGTGRRTAFVYAAAVALATPVGAVATFLYAPSFGEAGLGALLALAAGSFIYIGASDLMPRTHDSRGGWESFLVLLGVALSYGLVALIPHG